MKINDPKKLNLTSNSTVRVIAVWRYIQKNKSVYTQEIMNEFFIDRMRARFILETLEIMGRLYSTKEDITPKRPSLKKRKVYHLSQSQRHWTDYDLKTINSPMRALLMIDIIKERQKVTVKELAIALAVKSLSPIQTQLAILIHLNVIKKEAIDSTKDVHKMTKYQYSLTDESKEVFK